MGDVAGQDITRLLAAWSGGERKALDGVIALLYPEMRRLARRQLGHNAAQASLESAALANEVYLKLVRSGGIDCVNRVHFLAVCSQIVRRTLVDHARMRGYAKRGGAVVMVTLNEAVAGSDGKGIAMTDLDEALTQLAKVDIRKSRVVELRYFGGLTLEETAEVLNVSPETAKRDWRLARAWLFALLKPKARAAVPMVAETAHRNPKSRSEE